LRRSFQKGKLQFHGELESLAHPVPSRHCVRRPAAGNG
jgi:hypothetical protein